MEQHYGDFSFHRLNKAGLVCFIVMGVATLVFVIIDVLWVRGLLSLPSVFEVPYQIIYILWFAFLIFGVGIDKVTISEEKITIDVLYTRKKQLEKSELAYVVELKDRIYFVSIVVSLQIDGRRDTTLFRNVDGVICCPIRYKEKIIERGYEVII